MQKFILLGASRGLGWATYQSLRRRHPSAEFLISSRQVLKRQSEIGDRTKLIAQDFSKPVRLDFYEQLKDFQPSHLIYFAGGGPYGVYQSKKWSDHLWSLQTSFLYPAELLHMMMDQHKAWPGLKSILLIGSSIAESQPDPNAASYAAAKHALKGLVSTIQAEASSFTFKIDLFSPGYMQTDLLPAHSQPRLDDRAERPEIVAERLIEYIENKT